MTWQEEAREVTSQTIHDHWCDETPCTVTDADYEGSDEQALADAILSTLVDVFAGKVARAEARGKVAALREAADELAESTAGLPLTGVMLSYVNCTAMDVASLRRRADAIEAEAGER